METEEKIREQWPELSFLKIGGGGGGGGGKEPFFLFFFFSFSPLSTLLKMMSKYGPGR